MNKILEGYDEFTNNMFQNLHGAVQKSQYIPLLDVATDLTLQILKDNNLDINHMFYNPKGLIDRYIYWNGPVYIPVHNLDPQYFKMT